MAQGVYSIEDFPDELLCRIISLLPMKEAVRTSILSKKWRYLFYLRTKLQFILYAHENKRKQRRLMSFVDRVVLSRDIDSPSIEKFSLQCHQKIIDTQRVSEWVCALVCRKIQELDLMFGQVLKLPQSLFSCESLVVLKLYMDDYKLNVSDKICLPRLKTLSFQRVVLSDIGLAERLFLSCPVLEKLILSQCSFTRGGAKLNISNHNLRKLTLWFGTLEKEQGVVPIFITSPNLVYFTYKISNDHSLEFIDVKSISKLAIGLHAYLPNDYKSAPAAAAAFRQIYNVQRLGVCIDDMRAFQRCNVPIPLFDKLTCLNVIDFNIRYPDDFTCLEYFLARCVVIETLVFQEPVYGLTVRSISNQLTMQKSQLVPLLGSLKTIEVKLIDIRSAEALMAVIEFFLKNASVLKDVKIYYEEDHRGQKLEIMKKVKSFPKISQECKVSLAIQSSQSWARP